MIRARENWLILVDVPNDSTNLEDEMEWIEVDRKDVESIIELDQDSLDIGETRMKRLDTREDVPTRMIPMEKEDRDERDIGEEGERLVHSLTLHPAHTITLALPSLDHRVRLQYNPVSISNSCLIHTSYLTSTSASTR